MLIGAQIGLDTYLARRRRDVAWQPIKRQRPAPIGAQPLPGT
jgi:hypothetical protein